MVVAACLELLLLLGDRPSGVTARRLGHCSIKSSLSRFPKPSAGAALLLLGDRPSGVTARRMGDSIFAAVAPLFGAACAASLAADVAAATGALPGALSTAHAM